MFKKLVPSILFIISAHGIFAQTSTDSTKFIVDITLLDVPANLDHNGLAFKQFSPSMQQSLGFSKSIAEAQQYYTKRLFFKPNKDYTLGGKIIREAGLALANVAIEKVIVTTPLGTGWTHEEWHRAVLNKNNVRSYNNMNKFPIFAAGVSVNRVTDEELSNFKASNNADFTRLAVSGIEAQYEYVKTLQKDNFYYNLNLSSTASYWLNVYNAANYVNLSASTQGDEGTAEAEIEEGTNIEVRDFTGLDFTAWIYDLSRPDEAYEDRGINPSGVGIRRYRKTTDLTTEELNYLKKMGKLQWVNLISPNMFFINSIKVNEDFRFNFGMFHYLNSFGYDIGSNFFAEYKNNKIFFALHNYHNLENSFYGIEAELIDKEISIGNQNLFFTPSLQLWSQPNELAFRTDEGEFGGKIGLHTAIKIGKIWRPYVAISAKTNGWVAGDVYQSSNFSMRFGVSAFIK